MRIGRLKRVAKRWVGWFPLTPLGVLMLITALGVLEWFALPSLDLVLLVGCAGVLVLEAVALLLVALAAIVLRRRLARLESPEPAVVETARSVPTGVRLPRLAWVPFVDVRWTWVATPTSGDAKVTRVPDGWSWREEVEPITRGETTEVVRRLRVEDVLGLTALEWEHVATSLRTVLPHVGGLRGLPTLTAFAGGEGIPHPLGVAEGDRVELRPYAPGDPLRWVHWKAFARTRTLVVRMPEKALMRARKTVAYLVAGVADEAAAAAARVAVEGRALGEEWVFGADGVPASTSRIDEAVRAIVRSRGATECGLARFVADAERSGPASVVVFVPGAVGPWLDAVLALARTRPERTRIVIGVESAPRASSRARWWSTAPASSDASTAVGPVVRALAATRAEVVVVERERGRALVGGHATAVWSGGQA